MYRFLSTAFFIALCENIQHTLFYTQSLITRWSAGCLNCTSKWNPSLPLVDSMFNLEETPLLKLYICGMIKRFRQFWVASELPIGQIGFGRKLYFVLGFKCAESTEWRHPVSWGEDVSRFPHPSWASASSTGATQWPSQWLPLFLFSWETVCMWWFTITWRCTVWNGLTLWNQGVRLLW